VAFHRHCSAGRQDWSSIIRPPVPDYSATMQYNLVPADGRWRFLAGNVTAGLAESNGSLYRRVDSFKSPAGWLPVHRDQLRAQRSAKRVWENITFIPDYNFAIKLFAHDILLHNYYNRLFFSKENELIKIWDSERERFTTIWHTYFRIPKRELTSFNESDDS